MEGVTATEVGVGDEGEPVLGDALETNKRESWNPYQDLDEQLFDVCDNFCRR